MTGMTGDMDNNFAIGGGKLLYCNDLAKVGNFGFMRKLIVKCWQGSVPHTLTGVASN